MQIFLHNDVTATVEIEIVRLNKASKRQCVPGRIFGAVDKTKQVSCIEIAKALNLVFDGYGAAERIEDETLELETHVRSFRSNVK